MFICIDNLQGKITHTSIYTAGDDEDYSDGSGASETGGCKETGLDESFQPSDDLEYDGSGGHDFNLNSNDKNFAVETSLSSKFFIPKYDYWELYNLNIYIYMLCWHKSSY